MKKSLLIVFCLNVSFVSANDLLIENPYSNSFKKAYALNPSIPKGILEAVAFTQSRFTHLVPVDEKSCIDYPNAYGIMGLILDGKNYFRNNLVKVSQLSGYSESEIISSPESSILAYAKAISKLQEEKNVYGYDVKKYISIFTELSEIPLDNNLQNNFALNTHLYQLFWFLSNSEFQDFYSFPDYQINLENIFGDNYKILNSNFL